MKHAYSAIEARTVPIKKKIAGGALLISGAYIDHAHGLADKEKTEARIKLIKRHASGELTLKQLNEIW